MLATEDNYARDILAIKDRVKRLKENYARRNSTFKDPTDDRDSPGNRKPPIDEEKETASTLALQQLIARVLTDPSTSVPLDSNSLHKKLSQAEHALQYEEALRSASVNSIDPILREMGSGAAPAIEAEDYKTLGKTRVMILDTNRQRLLGITGFTAGQPPPSERKALLPPEEKRPPAGLPPGPPRPMGMPGMMPFGRPPMMGNMGPNFPGPAGLPGMPFPGMMPGMGPAGPGGMQMPHAGGLHPGLGGAGPPPPSNPPAGADLDSLLKHRSARDRQKTEKGEELLDLIQKPTAKETATVKRFKTEGGPAVREYCPHLTKDDCSRAHGVPFACKRLHFQRLVFPWTDLSLGNCSYLDTCRHMKTCKFVHYQLDDHPEQLEAIGDVQPARPTKQAVPSYLEALPEPQWLKIDVRSFDMTVLGKFGVIMADPPWEIHQDLPYGTMADDEMRKMNIGVLQDDGVIFLWVTGRAMELGRECLDIWGYRRVDELIWVKVNQLQRLIRTGRTGHWLNHSKEHCLVGVKGNPHINRNVDCDVVVGEVRETSRKPDEMYSLLERLSPGTRKLEIFARQHNVKPGWVCLGNQLAGINIKEPDMQARFNAAYPKGIH